MRKLQQIQEEFAAQEIPAQIIHANEKPIASVERDIDSYTETCFPQAEAKDIPFAMFDESYTTGVQSFQMHVLFAELWGLAGQNDFDSVLVSPEGQVVAKYRLFDGYDWHTDGLKEFITSHIR